MGAVMNPSLASVVRTRYWTIAAARGACVVWLAFGVQEVFRSSFRAVFAPLLNGQATVDWYNLFLDVSCLLVPALMFGSVAPLARHLLPLPRPACPSCDYAITNPEAARCPECGLQLGT